MRALPTRVAQRTVDVAALARSALLPPGWHRTGFLEMVDEVRSESLGEALRLVLVELGRGLTDPRESRITFAIGAVAAGVGTGLLNVTSSDGDAGAGSFWLFLALFIGVAADALVHLHHADPRFLSYFFAPLIGAGSLAHALTAIPHEPVDHLMHAGLVVVAVGAVLLMVGRVLPRVLVPATVLTIAGLLTVVVNNMVWMILHLLAARWASAVGAFLLGAGTWIFVRSLSASAGFPRPAAA